jgi:cytochrome c553
MGGLQVKLLLNSNLIRSFMSRHTWLLVLTTLGALTVTVRADDVEFFESKIRPILVDNCYKCHSATSKKLKGNLRLDTKEAMLKGGDNGPAIVPGNPEKSLLIQAIRYKNEDLQMPPKEKLSDARIADLEAWVKMGAPDPRSGAAKPAPATTTTTAPAAAASAYDFATERKKWAYRRPVDPKIPVVRDHQWPQSDLDRFILAKLEEKNLPPTKPADKRTLIRRATFDLIGLPPTPEEIDAFVGDGSPDAFARVVDRLLASPHYGERWARHWLDVVRYTDSFDARGIAGEADIPMAYRYRDWVVKAFNEDLPYDQFIMNQIAGDLLPAKKPQTFNADGLVATGVYVIGEWGTGDADKEKMLTDIVDDQIDVTGKAFLGLTLACARCHDHKFDPIPTEDYYSLAGIFFSSHILPNPGQKTAGSAVLRLPLASPQELDKRKQDQTRVAELGQQIEKYLDEQVGLVARQEAAKIDAYLAAAWEFKKSIATGDKTTIADFAAKRALHPYALKQWVEFDGRTHAKSLSNFANNINGIASLSAWHGADNADLPVALIHSGKLEAKFLTVTLPPRCVSVHPTPTGAVAVGWKSPISGKVRLEGRISDGDGVCGNGVDWTTTQELAVGRKALASGSIGNGGMQRLAEGTDAAKVQTVDVSAGDVIYLSILPKDNNNSCDTTVVELTITELNGAKRVWDLSADQMKLADAGKSASGSDVWGFYDLKNQPPATMPANAQTVLAKWSDALKKPGDENDLKAITTEVTQSLAKKDPQGGLYQTLTDPRGPFWAGARTDARHLPDQARRQIAKLQSERATLQQRLDQPVPIVHAIQEGGTPQSMFPGIQDVPIHIRGRYDRLGPVAPRRFPRLIAGDKQKPITQGSGRVDLAKWIASSDNPLTARVMANRIWQHHFGEGIVRTANNFGKQGTPPTHPELLDWLALRFIDHGWSMKAMHRMIMLSATYQQSSLPDEKTYRADPDNLLLGRMNRHRLEAEALRDALLVVTDTLDRTAGGPAQNDLNINRRTLYVMTIRSDRSNYRMLFDAADPVTIVEKRIDSTVAPQALFLLNHPFALAKTQALAKRVLAKKLTDDPARIDWLFRTLYARPPEANEIDLVMKALKTAHNGHDDAAAWAEVCQILLCANEFIYLD